MNRIRTWLLYLAGGWAIAAFLVAVTAGWIAAAVAVPNSQLFRQFIGTAVLAGLVGFAVTAMALGAIALFSALLLREIARLAEAAEALGKGAPVSLPRFRIRELDVVAENMHATSQKIADDARQLEKQVSDATRALRKEEEDRHVVEAALGHAQRLEALGQLTGSVAHDFNNFLTVISGNLELIERHASPEETKRYSRVAQKAVARAASLILSLLAFARKQPLQPEPASPNWLIKDFYSVLKGAAGDTVEIRLTLSPDVYPCYVDASQFQSALLNIIKNAADAMPKGGQIAIKTENLEVGRSDPAVLDVAPGDYVCVTVLDTGTGMAPEAVMRAFEPFFTTKATGEGTGLGLSQVYGFAKQSGGDVRLASKLGVGTTVCVYLPAYQEQLADGESGRLKVIEGEPIRARILLVEDDADVRSVLAEQIASLGCEVVTAADGPGALAKLGNGQDVDLVITDYTMPKAMSGLELARRIGDIAPHTKVLLISAHAEIPAGEDFGPFLVLQKPVHTSELRRAIEQVMDTEVAQKHATE